jgi:hypothetical protein
MTADGNKPQRNMNVCGLGGGELEGRSLPW